MDICHISPHYQTLSIDISRKQNNKKMLDNVRKIFACTQKHIQGNSDNIPSHSLLCLWKDESAAWRGQQTVLGTVTFKSNSLSYCAK